MENMESPVPFQDLKNQESVFLERIRAQFSDLNVLYHPLTEEPVFLGKNWKFVRESSEESRILSRLGTQRPLTLNQKKDIPLNRSITYVVNFPKGDLFGNFRSAWVEAKYWFNWNTFFLNREWNRPRSKTELLSFLADLLKSWQKEESFKGESLVVEALFSPSGWEEDAVQSIEGSDNEGKCRFVSPNMAVILVSDDCISFDKQNPLAVFLAPIFERELLRDRRSNCEKAISNALIGVQYVSLEGLVEALPFYPKPLIRETMAGMAKNSGTLIFESNRDVGDILRRRT
jgi:hypothetical protein